MADFSTIEKLNASWKHLFGIAGTDNRDLGKKWFEETLAASHIIVPDDVWTDVVPVATNITQARAASIEVVENCSDGISVILTPAGSDWTIGSIVAPKVGQQITNVHPNPAYIKSITTVVDMGLGVYKITLNNNTGVSAGSAVLHRRVYLTVDPTSNGLTWFARQIYGSHFSKSLTNFIQPQRFGSGYTVRLFQANGVEILTTQGAWIFNWQKGMLLFATGYTAAQQGYSQPLYIEGFRYVGALGVGSEIPAGELHDTLRFNGTSWVPTSAVKSDGTDLNIANRLTVSGSIVIPSGIAPITPAASGTEGELRWDDNFLYLRNGASWKRININNY